MRLRAANARKRPVAQRDPLRAGSLGQADRRQSGRQDTVVCRRRPAGCCRSPRPTRNGNNWPITGANFGPSWAKESGRSKRPHMSFPRSTEMTRSSARSIFVAPQSITGLAANSVRRGAKGVANLVIYRCRSPRLSAVTRCCHCHLDAQSGNDQHTENAQYPLPHFSLLLDR
jgi:hypothetical protein